MIRNLTIEAAWVGNRGAWLQGSVYSYNATNPAILAAHGLSLSRSADLTLLNSQIGSTAVKTAGYSLPFSNYPPTTTLTNALRPFPQYGAITPTSSIGNSWYDSLQTKRSSQMEPDGARDLHVGQVDYSHCHLQ
jgi:hypothetical protein